MRFWVFNAKLEMLAHLMAGQRDGHCRRQADDVGSFMTWGIPWLLCYQIVSLTRSPAVAEGPRERAVG